MSLAKKASITPVFEYFYFLIAWYHIIVTRVVFRYPYHPPCRVLNFPSVECWKIEEFFLYYPKICMFFIRTNKFCLLSDILWREVLSFRQSTWFSQKQGTHLQHKYAPAWTHQPTNHTPKPQPQTPNIQRYFTHLIPYDAIFSSKRVQIWLLRLALHLKPLLPSLPNTHSRVALVAKLQSFYKGKAEPLYIRVGHLDHPGVTFCSFSSVIACNHSAGHL